MRAENTIEWSTTDGVHIWDWIQVSRRVCKYLAVVPSPDLSVSHLLRHPSDPWLPI
jgi:hypothetical protein